MLLSQSAAASTPQHPHRPGTRSDSARIGHRGHRKRPQVKFRPLRDATRPRSASPWPTAPTSAAPRPTPGPTHRASGVLPPAASTRHHRAMPSTRRHRAARHRRAHHRRLNRPPPPPPRPPPLAHDPAVLKTLPRTGKRGAPQAFPHLLFMMLEREEGRHINWCSDGLSFEVPDKDVFVRETLPRYFRHSRFASFQRQLNLYGFKKTDEGELRSITPPLPLMKGRAPRLPAGRSTKGHEGAAGAAATAEAAAEEEEGRP